MEGNIDTDLYSRQIGAFGMDVMGKLLKLRVLIIGMRGLGVETAKNIILCGSYSVDIYDPNPVQINDLGSNFYLSLDDINKKNRDEACKNNLASLNPYVKVSVLKINSPKYSKEYISEFCSIIPNYDIIVFTEIQPTNFLIEIDNICRQKNVKMIYSVCLGLVCGVFVDFGKNHIILDEKGKEAKTYYVKNITKDKEGLVTIDNIQNTERLDLGDGNFVKFKNVEGMTELNDKEFQIYIEDAESFKIGDTSNFGDYKKGGIIYEIRKPKSMPFDDYKTRSEIIRGENNKYYFTDFKKLGRDILFFVTLSVLQDYYSENNFFLPDLNNMEIANILKEKVKQKYNEIKSNEKNIPCYQNMIEFDEKIAFNTIRWSKAHICPIVAFFGGIITQEIIKSTGQFIPINQWLFFDFFETVESLKDDIDRKLQNSRYDEQIAIYGNEIQKKLQKSNFFMVGAGATGCEFLKNFAMMGSCSDKNNKFIVTDNDNIEISNLSRQFLFKKKDVGKSKSDVAKDSVKLMNPEFNIESMQDLVSPQTENIFNEDFWERNDFIIYAVDSIDARKYIDTKAIMFEKCAIDSGTRGVEGRSQIIVPFETNTYNDEVPHSKVRELPVCTLRLFPSKVEHCIEWSNDYFSEYFFFIIADTKRFFKDKKSFIESFKEAGILERLELIKNNIDFIIYKNLEKIVEYAMIAYTNHFDYNIKSLLISFPADYKQKIDGKPLWGSSKIRPHEIPFDANDPICIKYIQIFIKILSHALNLELNPEELNETNIKKICEKIILPEFVVKNVNENEIEPQESQSQSQTQNQNSEEKNKNQKEEKKKINEILNELEKIDVSKYNSDKINPEKLEKDHDDNGHIDFIHLSANFRAKNYNIQECDRSKTKIIAGKIIPTILTSTASIAGIASLQIFTLLQTHDINYLRKCFFNLGRLEFMLVTPSKPVYKKNIKFNELIPQNISKWDKIKINGSKTCQEIIDFLKEKYGVVVDSLTSGDVTLISTFLPSSTKFLDRKVEDIYNEKAKAKFKLEKNYMIINVVASIEKEDKETKIIDYISVEMPIIKYIFK